MSANYLRADSPPSLPPSQVSMDIGEFEDSLRAYHRLLDLKEKFIDVEVGRRTASSVPN